MHDWEDEVEGGEEVPPVEPEGKLGVEQSTGDGDSENKEEDPDCVSRSGKEEDIRKGCDKCLCPNCDTITVLDCLINRLVRRLVRWMERCDRANLRPPAEKGRHGSSAVRARRVHHPALHGDYSRSYNCRRPIKLDELPTIPGSNLHEDDYV